MNQVNQVNQCSDIENHTLWGLDPPKGLDGIVQSSSDCLRDDNQMNQANQANQRFRLNVL